MVKNYNERNFYEVMIMNFDLRKAVIENLSTSNTEAIKEIIDDATTSKSETILPL